MSHAENKVSWCLRKAEKEIKEGKKHRGLVELKSDLLKAKEHIIKAEHYLKAVDYLNKGGFSDLSMGNIFYCIYHCFLAIVVKFGYESRNQECTIALIRYLKEQNKINIDERFIEMLENYDEKERFESNIIEKREFYTYGTTTSVNDKTEIGRNIDLCKDCLDQTKEIIFK